MVFGLKLQVSWLLSSLFSSSFTYFESWPCTVTLSGLELTMSPILISYPCVIFLPLCPECWCYRPVLPYPAPVLLLWRLLYYLAMTARTMCIDGLDNSHLLLIVPETVGEDQGVLAGVFTGVFLYVHSGQSGYPHMTLPLGTYEECTFLMPHSVWSFSS